MKSTPPPFSNPRDSSGSPTPGEPEFLVVARLGRPHGIHGEIAVEVLTDFPERIAPGTSLYIGPDKIPHLLRSRRPHKGGLLVSFEGYDQREQLTTISKQMAYVRAADRPKLPEGEYYHHQLLGLKVVAEEEQELGTLVDILSTGANDVYVIQPENGGEVLLPAIDSVILEIDLDRKLLRVHLLPGLLPE